MSYRILYLQRMALSTHITNPLILPLTTSVRSGSCYTKRALQITCITILKAFPVSVSGPSLFLHLERKKIPHQTLLFLGQQTPAFVLQLLNNSQLIQPQYNPRGCSLCAIIQEPAFSLQRLCMAYNCLYSTTTRNRSGNTRILRKHVNVQINCMANPCFCSISSLPLLAPLASCR